MHHPKSAVERMYLKRIEGGRGLLNLYELCKNQEHKMRTYFQQNNSPLTQMIVDADNNYSALNLKDCRDQFENQQLIELRNRQWREKVLHGRYPASLEQQNVDKERSLEWLRRGFLYPETEGFIVAIQDEVIRTRNYERNILKNGVEDVCRKCHKPGETIAHITTGCSALSANAYLGRHNQVAKIIHSKMANNLKLKKNLPPYFKYDPEPVLESSEYVLYWDRPILTDRTVDYNRPDIVLINKDTKTAKIIDVACPNSYNLQKTESEKVRKYENLAIEIKHVWKLKEVSSIPIIISATGMIPKSLQNNLSKLQIPPAVITTMQKAVLLQTCHIVRKFLGGER